MPALTRLTVAFAALACAATIASTATAQAPPPRLASDPAPQDSTTLDEAPTFHMVRGFITTADRRPARGLVARVKTSAGEQASAVKADGTFQVIAPAGDGNVQIIVDVMGTGERWYYPAWASIEPEKVGREQGFVLIPRVWQIPNGRYREKWIEINLDKAFEHIRPEIAQSFFMFQIDGSVDATNRDRPASWGLESLPISVAFDRDSSSVRIEDVDSMKFWNVLDSMEEDFGLDLFSPVNAVDLPDADSDEDRSIRVWVPSEMSGALGMANTDFGEKKFRRGWVQIVNRRLLRDHVLVKHEFMHALGFGHTCAWPTVLVGVTCRGITLDVASEFDVAHVQLSLNVNGLQRRTGARHGIVAAWNGQKRVMNQQVGGR